jgi:hypothetical protein
MSGFETNPRAKRAAAIVEVSEISRFAWIEDIYDLTSINVRTIYRFVTFVYLILLII